MLDLLKDLRQSALQKVRVVRVNVRHLEVDQVRHHLPRRLPQPTKGRQQRDDRAAKEIEMEMEIETERDRERPLKEGIGDFDHTLAEMREAEEVLTWVTNEPPGESNARADLNSL
jgi:hypothetical protein